MQETVVKPLSPLEYAAWAGLLRTHAGLVRELDHELVEAYGLPLTQYEVLIRLADAPDRRMRMTELARSVFLSQSGVTRLVDRLEAQGLVVREPCPEDRRGLHARLTDAGSDLLARARPSHLAGVRTLFLQHFDDDELRALAAAWERVSQEERV